MGIEISHNAGTRKGSFRREAHDTRLSMGKERVLEKQNMLREESPSSRLGREKMITITKTYST